MLKYFFGVIFIGLGVKILVVGTVLKGALFLEGIPKYFTGGLFIIYGAYSIYLETRKKKESE